MPKGRKKDDSSSEDSSGPEDRNPPAKKHKGDSPVKSKSGTSSAQSSGGGSNDESEWFLDKNKKVSVREWKGRLWVDIREMYDAGGEMKPGKKGICLNVDNYQKLKNLIPDIDAALKKK